MPALTDAEAKAFADALNKYEPKDIQEALDAMPDRGLRSSAPGAGEVASGPLDFGASEAGVLIYRTDAETVRMRLTIAEMTGGVYDDFAMGPDAFRRLVAALLETLEKRHSPHAP
jgi:hypothetical protein